MQLQEPKEVIPKEEGCLDCLASEYGISQFYLATTGGTVYISHADKQTLVTYMNLWNSVQRQKAFGYFIENRPLGRVPIDVRESTSE